LGPLAEHIKLTNNLVLYLAVSREVAWFATIIIVFICWFIAFAGVVVITLLWFPVMDRVKVHWFWSSGLVISSLL
jgi:hypothetical protein